ncbi:MAG: arsenic efflux protein [Spirochaetales bacterium]|nr:arsenic efflux protein [Spirochaetales bacterium]
MFDVLYDYFLDALIDSAKLIPFLYVIYLLMELLEKKAGNTFPRFLGKSKQIGPLAGGLIGVVPQCGLAAASASLYSGKVITLGTLIAVFLSASDEMLPILISSAYPVVSILKILLVKVFIAVVSGYIVDLLFKKGTQTDQNEKEEVERSFDEYEHRSNIFLCALRHTLEIFIFIFIFSLILNIIIGSVGEDNLSRVLNSIPVVGELVAALVGLIPNCASSVIITQLYLDGIITAGPMFAGLLVNAGVGTLVLFRTNRNTKNSLAIIGLLYALGVMWGSLIELLGLVF